MAVQAWIDGTEVTNVVLQGSSTRRLNLPSQASVTIPMDSAIGGVGSLLKISFDGVLHHHGRVLLCETDSGEDMGTTVYNSTDPMELWQWRPARDPDGDFSKPSFFTTFVTGPQILEQILLQSNDGSDPALGEGTLRLQFGSFATGGVSLSGAPTDWPMSIAQVASLLTSTGEVDIVLTPIDTGSNLAQIDVYNGDFGTDRSGSVIFEYGMGAHNVRRLRWNEDMTNMCNKLWYYGGPRVGTVTDPAGDQHWCFNVTADDPGLADPPQTAIEADRASSQAIYDVRMEVKIFDAESENCRDSVTNFSRELYRRLWQIESWLRQRPRTLIHITPIRNEGINDFDIGDLITVRAGSQVRGGFSGVQRIYEYTVSWDEDGVLELGELQTSPNNEGI
jgi:hypothetical protein